MVALRLGRMVHLGWEHLLEDGRVELDLVEGRLGPVRQRELLDRQQIQEEELLELIQQVAK